MKSQRPLLLASASILLSGKLSAASTVGADFTMWQEYSVGPNFALAAEPTGGAYLENMRTAARPGGFVNSGDSSTPGYFSTTTDNIPLSLMARTGPGPTPSGGRFFNSWLGHTNPGSRFGTAFANEYGNQLWAPLLIDTGSNGPITITSIGRQTYSVVQNGGPWQNQPISTWGNSRIGVTDFGVDGVLGGGDDTYIRTGLMASTPVVAFIHTGLGQSFVTSLQYNGDPWPIPTPNEDIIHTYYDQWGILVWDYSIDYTVNYTKGGGPPSVLTLQGGDFAVVPEPSTLGFGALACLCYLNRRRRPQPR